MAQNSQRQAAQQLLGEMEQIGRGHWADYPGAAHGDAVRAWLAFTRGDYDLAVELARPVVGLGRGVASRRNVGS